MTEDARLRKLGQVIQELRQELGWTQGRLSEVAQADRSQVSRLEAGERLVSAPVLARVAHALGTTADDLLARAGYLALPAAAQRAAAATHLLRVLEQHPPLHALVSAWPRLSEEQRARLIDFWLFEQARAQLHPSPAAPAPGRDSTAEAARAEEIAQALTALETALPGAAAGPDHA
jgi:transcriptional regulator with XRE-family HTH domain